MKIKITHNDISNMVAEVFKHLDNRSMLSEITTQDAYTRFYQGKIPDRVFQKLMLGSDQMTPLHKLALDHLVTMYAEHGKLREPKIVGMISKFWNSANNESKQYAIKVCKDDGDKLKNNLDLFEQVITELANMKSHSESSYVERGFEVLFEDDNLAVTCTKSYSSSCRHYGKSHWCTASDQFGEYDGFQMFRRYTIASKAILVQFVIKNNTKLTSQAQINRNRGSFGQICNWDDDSENRFDLDEIITSNTNHSLKEIFSQYILPNLSRLYKETEEIARDENVYYVRKKAERIKTITSKFSSALNSKECEDFAKKVFVEKMRLTESPWRGTRLIGITHNPNFVSVSYLGKTQAESDFIDSYLEEEGYYVEEYGFAIPTNIIFLFDNSGNIINKYIGFMSLTNNFFCVITDVDSDNLYWCRANYVVKTDNGQVLLKDMKTCDMDDSDNYLESFDDDEELAKLLGREFRYGEWLIMADKNNNAYALSTQNGDIVKVPYISGYF